MHRLIKELLYKYYYMYKSYIYNTTLLTETEQLMLHYFHTTSTTIIILNALGHH